MNLIKLDTEDSYSEHKIIKAYLNADSIDYFYYDEEDDKTHIILNRGSHSAKSDITKELGKILTTMSSGKTYYIGEQK